MVNFMNLSKQITDGEIALFIGAGCSIASPSCLPDFITLRNYIIEILLDCKDIIIPVELKNRILNDIAKNWAKPELLFNTISKYVDINKINLMRCLSTCEYNINHKYIAKLCKKGIKLIITTNFDLCIEKALKSENISYIQYNGIPQTNDEVLYLYNIILNKKDIIIWKPHGDAIDTKSLSFTLSQISKLKYSKNLRYLFKKILNFYSILTMGYSGYDDDFYPLFFDGNDTNRINNIVWNTYKEPIPDAPVLALKNKWKESLVIWVGDVKLFLENLIDKSEDIVVYNREKEIWKEILFYDLDQIPDDTRLAIIGKYLNLIHSQNCRSIWEYGRELKNISEEHLYRFLFNLSDKNNITDLVEIFDHTKFKYDDISLLALKQIIHLYTVKKEFKLCNIYIRCFKEICSLKRDNEIALGDYYVVRAEFLLTRYMEKEKNTKIINDMYLKAYKLYEGSGDILSAFTIIDTYYGNIIQNYANIEAKNVLLEAINLLKNYAQYIEVSHIYYNLCNNEIQFHDKEVAYEYACKSEEYIHLVKYLYSADEFKTILSLILHQKAMCLQYINPDMAIETCEKAIELRLNNDSENINLHMGTYYSTYMDLLYAMNKYSDALRMGRLAIDYHIGANDIRGYGRSISTMGFIEMKKKHWRKAVEFFNIADEISLKIGDEVKRSLRKQALNYCLSKLH